MKTNNNCTDCPDQTPDTCCHETIRTDDKAQCHIISEQDKRYHDLADKHIEVMGMFSTLVQTKSRDAYFNHENWSNC